MMQFLIDDVLAGFISIFLVVLTTIIYYEVLRFTWNLLPHLTLAPRFRVVVVILAIFLGHTLAVWTYGVTYWLLSFFQVFGGLKGTETITFLDYIYYSVVTYSSLGYGDLLPDGALRMISGVEVLNGLVLIGWSISFTYLALHRFWDLHPKRPKKKKTKKIK